MELWVLILDRLLLHTSVSAWTLAPLHMRSRIRSLWILSPLADPPFVVDPISLIGPYLSRLGSDLRNLGSYGKPLRSSICWYYRMDPDLPVHPATIETGTTTSVHNPIICQFHRH